MSNYVSGAVYRLIADLMNVASAIKGAALIAFSYAHSYAAGTVGAAIKNASANIKRTTPDDAFSWAGIVPVIAHGVGNARPSESVSRYARRVHAGLIGVGVVYVDPINGLDTNSGSISAPVKTLTYACRTLNPSQIYCVAGTYAPFEFRATDVPGNKLKIITALGKCTIANPSDDPSAATWTADGTFPNVWWMPLTPTNKPALAVLDATRQDAEGQPHPLTKYASISAVNTAGEGWYHDTGANRLYVRYMGGGVNVNTVKNRLSMVTGDSTTKVMAYGTKLLFEGEWSLRGVFLQPLEYATAPAYVYMETKRETPAVSYTLSHGLDALGCFTYLQNVWMHACQGDNFHYTDGATLPSNGVEIDCKATDAGNIAAITTSPGTSNGSTTHGTCNVIRMNGVYRRNYGPDVVDTGTGKSWNIGVEAGPGLPSGNAFGIYTTGPEMWLDSCHSHDHPNADIAATTGGVIHSFSTSYKTSSGPIDAYTP